MSEIAEPAKPTYGNFVRDAFIKPIRTVIVVDDEFPTLDAMIDRETGKNDKMKWQPADVNRAREIIDFCREENRKWIVEFNDGRFQPESGMDNAISHLHQSDLLILDFHLDPANQEDGARAIHILRHLASNDHFNLVVVYTKGYEEAAGRIEQVAREIAVGLSSQNPKMNMAERALKSADEIVETWADEDPKIDDRLKDAVDEVAYLKARPLVNEAQWDAVLDLPEIQPLQVLMESCPNQLSNQKKRQILKWSLHHRQQALLPRLFENGTDEVSFAWEANGANWIRTERIFVTVLGKTNAPRELPEKLAVALEKWKPEPHRLLMSRMRAELDEQGVLAEAGVLGNCFLQVGWLEEFLNEDPQERTWKIRNTVTRHWESLGEGIQEKVLSFSMDLADHLLEAGREEALARHSPITPGEKRDEIALHTNRYMCSKPVEGHHLTTGHILRITKGGLKSFWLCLSPACDLVPGQKTSGWAGRLKNFIAFIVVELFSAKSEEALASAYSGNHLFLEIDGKIECFSFTPLPVSDVSEVVMRSTNPKWEQMFADNNGCFAESRIMNIWRISSNGNNNFTATSTEADIVAQLRYEYALNLLHRLGSNLSRVGLDFTQTI